MTYDTWKATEPDNEPWQKCHVCGHCDSERSMFLDSDLQNWLCGECAIDEFGQEECDARK